MHRSLLGQGMQSLPENFIFITLVSCLSMAGVQLMLFLSSGQVATSLSQSMVNAAASKPVFSREQAICSPGVLVRRDRLRSSSCSPPKARHPGSLCLRTVSRGADFSLLAPHE